MSNTSTSAEVASVGLTTPCAVPPTAWHIDIDINGQPYPTRAHDPDAQGSSDDCYDLPAEQLDYVRAVHEAGHAIAVLIGGGHLHHAEITTGPATSDQGGVTSACNLADGTAYAAHSAAGVRAADRWLHEAGLWTPKRAVAVEVGAYRDRQQFLRLNPHVGYGDKQVDYQIVHDLADRALDQHWSQVISVADALAHHHHLSGDAIAELAHLANGTHTAAT